MRIKNYDGRSWVTQYKKLVDNPTIHITNAEVQSVEIKGTQLIIKVKKDV